MFMNLFPKESSGSIFGLVCLIGLLSPSLAHAGFEWTPPPANVAAAPTTPSSAELNAAPAGPLTPEPDTLPVPVGNVESAPVATPQEPIVVDNAPVSEPAPEPEKPVVVEAAPVAEPTPAPASAPISDDVVEGFGKDIPLAMALRDIVPAKYAYAFSPRDIAGVKISWRGGKPWQDVLKDALAPYDFDVSVNDTNIVIFAKQYTAPVAAPAASAPAEPPVAPSASADPLPLVSADEPAPASTTTMVARRPAEMDTAPATTEVKKDDAPLIRTAVDMNDTRRWEARPGKTLRQTLEVWAKESNVELNWSTPYDYPINNAFYYDGSFAQAVDSLLSTYGRENPNPKGRLYPNLPEGPSVLMVN